ncbi:MAG: D-Ala-D-Ala carboxypeptidase family metallohydrolase [Gemmatimonadota bacterium]|nr:D-Ala-D-Ala carboxypeptidase family metallohydrolase [Gemmatimonadota bacterium]
MSTLYKSVFVLLVMCGSIIASEQIDTLRDMYRDEGLKVPDRNHFTNGYSSKYFSSWEIGNRDNTDFTWYLANGAFWWSMDNIREAVGGQIVLNSTYRNPFHNNDEGGEDDSLHQYGNAADARKFNGVKWSEMNDAQKQKIRDHIQEAEITLKAEYGDAYFLDIDESDSRYLHIELMNYCDYPDNYS